MFLEDTFSRKDWISLIEIVIILKMQSHLAQKYRTKIWLQEHSHYLSMFCDTILSNNSWKYAAECFGSKYKPCKLKLERYLPMRSKGFR